LFDLRLPYVKTGGGCPSLSAVEGDSNGLFSLSFIFNWIFNSSTLAPAELRLHRRTGETGVEGYNRETFVDLCGEGTFDMASLLRITVGRV